MTAARNVMELVDRKLKRVEEVDNRINRMPQSTEDFFTRDDRRELYRQSFQAEQILSAVDEMKATNKETAKTHMQAMEAHEARIRALEDSRLKIQNQITEDLLRHTKAIEGHAELIRALEDDRLTLRTQIKTSWWWIMLVSAGASAAVNFAIKLLLK